MKDISETHPSLKPSYGSDYGMNKVIGVEQIQKHTTDNAVLKAVIQRVCLQTGAEVTEAQLLIELGLEEK